MPEDHTNNPRKAELDALEAFLDSLEGKGKAALARLEGKTDPDSIAQRLQILLDADGIQEGVELIRGREPHEKWCDRAAYVLARHGDWDAAKKIAEWAESLQDLATRHRCIIACAQGGYAHGMRTRREGDPIRPGTLTPEEERELRQVLPVLDPFTQFVMAKRRVDNEIESQGVQLAILCHMWLRHYQDVRELARILETRKPLPRLLARLALMGFIQAKEEWPRRLREEHGASLDIHMLAALTECACLGKASEAFRQLLEEVDSAAAIQEKEQLFSVLDQVAQAAGADELAKVNELAPRLIGHNSRLLRLHQADRFLRGGKMNEAQEALAETRDENDPVWLQIQAQCLLQQGDGNAAAGSLRKACDILPHPAILGLAAQVAFRQDRLRDARYALEQLLNVLPDDSRARRNMATVCMLEGDFGSAAEHFAVLQSLQPEDPTHGLNRATCLVRSNDLDGSLRVYDAILGGTSRPLEALLGKAETLKALDRSKEAFQQLRAGRQDHWDDPRFVLHYMDLSYAAEEEAEGHQALLQLMKLQALGKAEPEMLQAKTIENLKDYIADHMKRVDELHQGILQGRIPWLMADRILNVVSYWGWLVRTQAMRWVWDDPVNRARHAIYATNGFAVRVTAGKKKLLQLAYPPRGTRIAVDLSALITLHRLDMLRTAAEYFGQVLVPSAYLSHAAYEKGRLVLHQASYRTSLAAVKERLDSGVFKAVVDAGAPGARPLPYVNEHTLEGPDEEHCYRLIDLITPLFESGRLPADKHRELLAVSHKPSGVDTEHPPLGQRQPILVGLSTLQTISQFGALDVVANAFAVHITEEDRQAVIGGMASLTAQENVYRWHAELWEAIRSDSRFSVTPCAVPKNLREETQPAQVEVAFASSLLAQEVDVPLLVDDRACQAMLLNARPDHPYSALGTDCLLLGLAEAGLIDQERLAGAMCQLMAWRYRFILPSSQVLKTLADRYRDHPPGQDLRNVALYVHDCMRDPGLFGGLEPTVPPTTLATRLFQAWVGTIGEFLVAVWGDEAFAEDRAAEITRWAMHVLLPSTPRSAGPRAPVLASLLDKMVLSNAMIRACTAGNQNRMRCALKAMADGLGMTSDDFVKATVEIIDEF